MRQRPDAGRDAAPQNPQKPSLRANSFSVFGVSAVAVFTAGTRKARIAARHDSPRRNHRGTLDCHRPGDGPAGRISAQLLDAGGAFAGGVRANGGGAARDVLLGAHALYLL